MANKWTIYIGVCVCVCVCVCARARTRARVCVRACDANLSQREEFRKRVRAWFFHTSTAKNSILVYVSVNTNM